MKPKFPFEQMVRNFTQLMDEDVANEDRILERGRVLLTELIAGDDWLPDSHAQPHPEHYRQYLLHLDPQQRFSIVSFVWGPGQKTPAHDHTVWGLIGVLRGAERCERFASAERGKPMQSLGEELLEAGQVDCVSPSVGDIHRVSNAFEDRVSVSIHIYGADIGRVRRHTYNLLTGEAREFVSGYANVVTTSPN
jgi:predicted metal-dependent enzyme (double-stranded beta helix superfamily)